MYMNTCGYQKKIEELADRLQGARLMFHESDVKDFVYSREEDDLMIEFYETGGIESEMCCRVDLFDAKKCRDGDQFSLTAAWDALVEISNRNRIQKGWR